MRCIEEGPDRVRGGGIAGDPSLGQTAHRPPGAITISTLTLNDARSQPMCRPMSRTTTVRRVLVGALAVTLAVLLTGCLSSGQDAVWQELNADRRANGRSSLPTHDQLNRKAQAWAEKIARDGRLSHSSLSSGVPSCWKSLAENVGYASSAAAAQDAFMRSAGHKSNILATKWKWVGVGYAKAGSRVYVVQVFMQGC